MKKIVYLISIVLMLSCQSNKSYYSIGTTGSLYGVDPYPDPEQWDSYLNHLLTGFDKTTKKSILWVTGTYRKDGIKFNFPGNEDIDNNTYFSELDFNIGFFESFNNKNIDVYLLIEPGITSVENDIRIVLDKYKKYKSVAGVCIDLEWFENGIDNKLNQLNIESWLNIILEYNNNYRLILKHWNIKKIDPFINKQIIYIQSMQSITSFEELKKRHSLWARKFYPSHVGVEVGFKSDLDLWSIFENPIFELSEVLNELSLDRNSIYWNETTLLQYIDLLEARDK